MSLRIERDLPDAADSEVETMFDDVHAFWEISLLRHFRAENECLVSRLTRHVPLDDESVGRICRDHIQLDGLIMSMRDVPSTASRRSLLHKFGALLREHVHWEEDFLFEKTQEVLHSDELDALGDDLADRIPETFDFPVERLYPKVRNPRAGN